MGGGRKEGYSEHADSNTGINVVKVNIYIHTYIHTYIYDVISSLRIHIHTYAYIYGYGVCVGHIEREEKRMTTRAPLAEERVSNGE